MMQEFETKESQNVSRETFCDSFVFFYKYSPDIFTSLVVIMNQYTRYCFT